MKKIKYSSVKSIDIKRRILLVAGWIVPVVTAVTLPAHATSTTTTISPTTTAACVDQCYSETLAIGESRYLPIEHIDCDYMLLEQPDISLGNIVFTFNGAGWVTAFTGANIALLSGFLVPFNGSVTTFTAALGEIIQVTYTLGANGELEACIVNMGNN